MKPPAIQFYFSDFLASTIHMTHGERGLYIMLLGTQWTQGYVTESDFARAARGLSESDSVDIVRSKFQKGDDGHLRQGRMEAEREKQLAFRNERAESGRRGAIAKAQLQLSQSSALAQLQPPSPSPSPSPISNTVTVKTVRFAPPSLGEVKAVVAEKDLQENDAVWFYHKGEASGWTNNGRKIKSWQSTVAAWKAAGIFPSQKQQSRPSPQAAAPATLSPAARAFALSKELERIEVQLKDLDRQAYEPSGLSADERVRRKELRAKREELRKELNL